MPLDRIPTPFPFASIVEMGLASFRLVDPLRMKLLDAAQGGTGERLEVFTLGVPDVVATGSGLGAAKRAGWRVAVADSGQAIAGDVYTVQRGAPASLPAGTPRLACVRQGPHVAKMLDAITALRSLPGSGQATSPKFSASLLMMPSLFTEALWLQPLTDGSEQQIVPYFTLIKDFPMGVHYSEQLFLQYLRPVAQGWLSRRLDE